MNEEQKPIVDLENWYFYGKCLYGEAINHPKASEEKKARWFVAVSRIIRDDSANGVVETRNTIYHLKNRIQVQGR